VVIAQAGAGWPSTHAQYAPVAVVVARTAGDAGVCIHTLRFHRTDRRLADLAAPPVRVTDADAVTLTPSRWPRTAEATSWTSTAPTLRRAIGPCGSSPAP
jgi:hypothetical protein